MILQINTRKTEINFNYHDFIFDCAMFSAAEDTDFKNKTCHALSDKANEILVYCINNNIEVKPTQMLLKMAEA